MAYRNIASQITAIVAHNRRPPSTRGWLNSIEQESTMNLDVVKTNKTVIVTGGSQGIGAGVVRTFLDRGYSVVANARNITKSHTFAASDKLALVDGNIAEPRTADKIVEVAMNTFGSVDALVNNAGIFFSKPFIEYTIEDLRALSSVNIDGFLFISQLVIKQMLAQNAGGSIVNITATSVDHPNIAVNASIAMITKGGLEAVTRSLAIEYAKKGIRVNSVAPGIVDTPMHKSTSKDFLKTLQPMGGISSVKDIVDAIVYLTEATQVTGEVLHVDGGAHAGKW
jgi:NAD(P)-dependent dehydrogenase (short-subunit alcohol dehydrogenase family)